MSDTKVNELQAQQERSLANPSEFWKPAVDNVSWYQKPENYLNDSKSPFNAWFEDGEINACFNAIDTHVAAGRGDQAAIIHDSPVTDSTETITYQQLLDRTATFAGALTNAGISKGDRVLVYMPMIPEAMVAVLACARLGALHSVVFGGFAANELAVRIDDSTPDVIASASCGIETTRVIEYKPLLDEALELASHKPRTCFIKQRAQCVASLIEGRDLDWDEACASANPHDCVPVKSTDPLYILYTSGTTGQPKGVVKDTGGTVVSLKWTMKSIYDVEPGDVFWAASDIGWVVGHSYIIYGPLLNGNTTVLYEGKPVGTPDAGAFWRVISQHKVKVLFTAPTAFRAIKKEDSAGELLADYDLSSLKTLFLAGERCDPDTLAWAMDKLKIPVIDHWWQTETGYAICATCTGIEMTPIVSGSPGQAIPGYDVQVLDSNQQPAKPGEIGALVIKLPLPPGTFVNLWNAADRYKSAYFDSYPGHYETGDAGYIDEQGYVFVMARTDDVINVAGHRLSTGAMEEVLASHPDVAECAVMGVSDQLKGQLPFGFLVLNSGVEKDDQTIVSEVISMVRAQIGPVAAFKLAAVVPRLPKTRSGKILRATMRSIADGTDWKMPATIDDPTILDEITNALKSIGYAKPNDYSKNGYAKNT